MVVVVVVWSTYGWPGLFSIHMVGCYTLPGFDPLSFRVWTVKYYMLLVFLNCAFYFSPLYFFRTSSWSWFSWSSLQQSSSSAIIICWFTLCVHLHFECMVHKRTQNSVHCALVCTVGALCTSVHQGTQNIPERSKTWTSEKLNFEIKIRNRSSKTKAEILLQNQNEKLNFKIKSRNIIILYFLK